MTIRASLIATRRGLAGFRQPFLVIINDDGTETPNVTATGHAVNFGPIGSALLWAPFFVAGDLTARVLHARRFPCRSGWLFRAVYLGRLARLRDLGGRRARALVPAGKSDHGGASRVCSGNGRMARHARTLLQPPRTHVLARAFMVRRRALSHRLVSYTRRRMRTWRGWVALGLAGGLMGLVREQDAVFLMVPAVDEAIRLLPGLRRPAPHAGGAMSGRTVLGGTVMAVAAFVAFIPQLAVYKTLYGDFRPSSDVSQKMHYNAPNGLRVLFNPEHGLFLWTPALLLAVVGLGLLIRRDARLGLALCTGLGAHVVSQRRNSDMEYRRGIRRTAVHRLHADLRSRFRGDISRLGTR